MASARRASVFRCCCTCRMDENKQWVHQNLTVSTPTWPFMLGPGLQHSMSLNACESPDQELPCCTKLCSSQAKVSHQLAILRGAALVVTFPDLIAHLVPNIENIETHMTVAHTSSESVEVSGCMINQAAYSLMLERHASGCGLSWSGLGPARP